MVSRSLGDNGILAFPNLLVVTIIIVIIGIYWVVYVADRNDFLEEVETNMQGNTRSQEAQHIIINAILERGVALQKV